MNNESMIRNIYHACISFQIYVIYKERNGEQSAILLRLDYIIV